MAGCITNQRTKVSKMQQLTSTIQFYGVLVILNSTMQRIYKFKTATYSKRKVGVAVWHKLFSDLLYYIHMPVINQKAVKG